MPSRLLRAALALVLFGFVAACDSTDPSTDDPGAGEQELISNVVLSLTPQDGAGEQAITADAVFNEDGQLDAQASQLTLDLTPGTTYAGSIAFTNRFADDPDERDVTAEVRVEATEHQVFYAPLDGLASVLQINYADDEAAYAGEADDDAQPRSGVPVGLAFMLTVDADATPTSGGLRIVLAHYDERPKEVDEAIGDAPERDVDVTFQVAIQ